MTNEDQTALLIRIDERTRAIEKQMEDVVTKTEFEPVKKLCYGLVGTILLSVVGAITTLVVGVKKWIG